MKTNDESRGRRAHPKKGLGVHDVLYVLFKHKWRILCFWLVGLGAAAGLIYHAVIHPSYDVCAKLLVRYVLERSAVDPYEAKVDVGGARGVAIMDAEIEIIRSADLLLEVVNRIGPGRLLPDKGGKAATATDAVVHLADELDVVAAMGSNVIAIHYRNRDPELAVAVLEQLIDCYFARHLEIHRSTGAFENVARETDQARSRLGQTEEELRKLSNDSGVLSYAGTKAALEERRNRVSALLVDARVEQAQQRVRLESLERGIGATGVGTPEAVEKGAAAGTPGAQEVDRARMEGRYADLAGRLALFKQKRNELMVSRKPSDRMVASLDRQIAEVEERMAGLQGQYPGLGALASVANAATPGQVPDLQQERAQMAALDAKARALDVEAREVSAEAERLSAIGMEMTKLERRRELEEEKYRYLQTSLEKARVDEALDPRTMPNIGVVQRPSTPVRSIPVQTWRLSAGLAVCGVIGGLLWAFVTEWVIDRRVSRPIEIQTRLQLPLMLTIPWLRGRHDARRLIQADGATVGNRGEMDGQSGTELIPEEGGGSEDFITPYAAAIRDRILFNFAMNNITHKPKLVGLTGLSPGAGASTLAIGLARAFAEGGGLKVLLVDLNAPDKNAPRVDNGRIPSLQAVIKESFAEDFITGGRRLYLASAPTRANGRGASLLASAAIHEMLPQLEASRFDYIIFDMPPVAPTSPTLAMAGFMDKVLLVLDAGNTSRESLSWSYAELEKGKADVSCIFNKAKSHAPRWVAGEI